MILPEEGCLLRIFIGESDRHSGKPLYEWIVVQARANGLAGATALLLGVKGVCVISHGSSGDEAMVNAIRVAAEMVDVDMVGHLTSAATVGTD